ncbi:hypothetical protein IFT54_05665 [Sphingomonas sp. CFBP 13714]|uniref:hypothetical protein n=1 Tax=Sphingomonas sp. CFBP 13714 TaxID=2775308 RepID=UPI00178530B4|nr:hypothetical protein [Sphingomonas sp. CFBP 13714]MBD8699302.1 hypothetical protein [Sphingomonas sp. CFBP 13714]
MDWKALIDKTLGTHFDAPVYDPAKGRAKLVKVIDKAAEQHKEGKTPPTRSWKLGSNRAISFAPTLNGNPVLLQGEPVSYVPAERFQDFLSGLKAAVQAGDLDDEIKAAIEESSAGGSVGGGKAASRATAPKGTRTFSEASSLTIGVAAKRRAKSPPSFEDIRAAYIEQGANAELLDAAIAKRKAAEKAAQ